VHSFLKIKLFLIHIFEGGLFQNNKFLYSHFDFVHQNGLVVIRIFLYHVGFFRYLSDFFIEFNNEFVFYLNLNKNLKNKEQMQESFSFISSVCIFFKLFSGYFLKFPLQKKVLKLFLFSGFSIDFYLLKKILFSKSYLNLKNSEKFEFLFFFSILIFLSKQLKNKKFYFNAILEHLFISAISFKIFEPFFSLFKRYILIMVNHLIFKGSMSLNFYLLSNDGLTAKFISRFIAVRFTGNRFLSEVVDPIKSDLINTMSLLESNKFSLKSSSFKLQNEKLFLKGLLKRLFLVFVSIY
jgi:hypothetical protein